MGSSWFLAVPADDAAAIDALSDCAQACAADADDLSEAIVNPGPATGVT